MKTNRRGFFGFGAGAVAVAAAPQTLQTNPVHKAYASATPMAMNSAELAIIEAEREAVKKQIDAQYLKKLKRIASGDLTEDELNANTIKDRPSYRRFRPIKSMSDNARDFCQARLDGEIERRNLMQQAADELAKYDKTGVFRNVMGWYHQVEREVKGYDNY